MFMCALYIISTPIGNRKDITLRAVETLFTVDILLCEDTRKTGQLLHFYRQQFNGWPQNDWLNIGFNNAPQLVSFYDEIEDQRIPYALEMLNSGKSIGLVSNAGTPGISDPGFSLVNVCMQNNIPIISIPGPAAVISAISTSGYSADKFTFLSFLPKKAGKQSLIWQSLKSADIKQTIIFYESPFRIKKTLETLLTIYGDINICIARELTKIHEEIKTLPISQWLTILTKPLKGELVVLFRQT